MRAHYEFTTALPPEGVVSALTDFSERRPEIWPGLDPARYKVQELGATWAVVTEGSRSPKVWARERYDWSVTGAVSWRVEESNFCRPGSGIVATVSPGPGSGSRVSIDWERIPAGAKGYVIALAVRVAKDRALGFKSALDQLAEGRQQLVRKAA
jgi:hypothetical protein